MKGVFLSFQKIIKSLIGDDDVDAYINTFNLLIGGHC